MSATTTLHTTTLTKVLAEIAEVARELLNLPEGDDRVHLGAVRSEDVARGYRLAVWPSKVTQVDHEGCWRRTAQVVVALVAHHDPSMATLGASEMLQLVDLFEPVHLGLLERGEGFSGPGGWLRDSEERPGCSAEGYDDGDRAARIGAAFSVTFNTAKKGH